jgi:hypothetical protein
LLPFACLFLSDSISGGLRRNGASFSTTKNMSQETPDARTPSALAPADPNFLLLHPIIIYHRQLATEFYEHVLKQINYPPAATPLPSIDEEKVESAPAPVFKFVRVFIGEELKIDSTGFLTLKCIDMVSVRTVKETVMQKLNEKQGKVETINGVSVGFSAGSCDLSVLAKDKGDRLDRDKAARKGAPLEEKSVLASHFAPDTPIYEVILTQIKKPKDRRMNLPRVLARLGTEHHTFRFEVTIKGIRLALPAAQSLLSVQWVRGPRAVQSMYVAAESLPEVSPGVMGWTLAPLSLNASLYADKQGYQTKASKLLIKRRGGQTDAEFTVTELGFVEIDLALCASAADQEKTTEFSLPLQACPDKAGMLIVSVHTVPASAEDPNEEEKDESLSRAHDEDFKEHEPHIPEQKTMPAELQGDIKDKKRPRLKKKKAGFATLRRLGTKTCVFQFELVVQSLKFAFPDVEETMLSIQWLRGSHSAHTTYVAAATLPESSPGVRQWPASLPLSLTATMYQDKKSYQPKISKLVFKSKNKNSSGNELIVVSEIGCFELDLTKCLLVDQESPHTTEFSVPLEGTDPGAQAVFTVKSVVQAVKGV